MHLKNDLYIKIPKKSKTHKTLNYNMSLVNLNSLAISKTNFLEFKQKKKLFTFPFIFLLKKTNLNCNRMRISFPFKGP